MRALATGLLALMAALFVAASLAERRWPAAAWLRAFAEAGTVGACADWFAVTALFRRPFGLPIPHTGIVPRNKDRIGAALGDFIADNFLTEAVLTERLRRIEVARWGGAWLAEGGGAARLAEQVADLLPDVLDALPPDALRTLAGASALAAARAAPAADLAARALSLAWSGGRAQALIERGAALLRDALAEREDLILEKVHAQSYAWMPKFVDKIIARKIAAGVIQLLDDLRDPAHPWRQGLDDQVRDWTERLHHDPELRARAEAVKRSLLDDPGLQAGLDALFTGLEGRLAAGARANRAAVTAQLTTALAGVGRWLTGRAEVHGLLNDWSAATICGVIVPRRHEIGRFVAAVVASWDAEEVVARLEQQVGRDLQYIRINGTLVGGLVGLLIHAATRLGGLA